MEADINKLILCKDEEVILIQVWVYRLGTGSARILTGKPDNKSENQRDEKFNVNVDPKALLDFIREQTTNRS